MTTRRYILAAVMTAAVTLSLGGKAIVKPVNVSVSDSGQQLQVETIKLSEPALLDTDLSNGLAASSYSDYWASLEDMRQHSDLIVVGRPVSAKQKKLGILSTVEVSQTLHGTVHTTIQLVQLPDDALTLQQEYILFLGKQSEEDDDTFFIKGGIQGALFEQDGQWISRDPHLTEEIANYYAADGDTKANLLHFLLDEDNAEQQEEAPVNEREQSFFLNDQLGWRATYSAYGMFREDMMLYRTTDGGQTWPELASSNTADSTLPGGIKSGLVFASESEGWITTNAPWDGKVGLYATRDGGSTWQEAPVDVPDSLQSAQLYVYPPLFVTADAGILITRPMADSSLLYVTDDRGAHWTPIVDEQQGSHNGLSWSLSADGMYTIRLDNKTWILNTSGDGTWGQI